MNVEKNPNIVIGEKILEAIQANLLKNCEGDDGKAILKIEWLGQKGYYCETETEKYIVIPFCVNCTGKSPAWKIKINILIVDENPPYYPPKVIEIENLLPNGKEKRAIKIKPFYFESHDNMNCKTLNLKFVLKYFDSEKFQTFSYTPKLFEIDYKLKETEVFNPFTNRKFKYPESKKNLFYGRENLMKYMLKKLDSDFQEKSIVINLYGERGIGKTAFVSKLNDELSKKRQYKVLFLSLEKFLASPNCDEIFLNLLNDLKDYLNTFVNINIDLKFNTDEFWTDKEKFTEKFIKRIEKGFIQLVKTNKIVLIFDDFDIFLEKLKDNFLFTDMFAKFILFLLKIENNFNLRLIFVTKNKFDEMGEKFEYWRDLAFQSFSREVGFLKSKEDGDEEEEVEKFLEDSFEKVFHIFKEANLRLKSSVKQSIKEFVGGHPYLLQVLCYDLVETMKAWKYIHLLDFWDVEYSARKIVESPNSFVKTHCLKYIWDSLSLEEKWALIILKHSIDSSIYRRVTLMEFGSALLKQYSPKVDFIILVSILLAKNLIEEKEGYYKFKMKLFEFWIEKNKKQIKEILSSKGDLK